MLFRSAHVGRMLAIAAVAECFDMIRSDFFFDLSAAVRGSDGEFEARETLRQIRRD